MWKVKHVMRSEQFMMMGLSAEFFDAAKGATVRQDNPVTYCTSIRHFYLNNLQEA